jgi:LacI family transcriptional regulator
VRRVGIRDVARHAGVSVGTVSNVLNRVPSVSDEYVRRVQSAVAALGFVRNDNARQLKAGGSRTISLLVLTSFNPFFNALAEAAEDAAEGYGHSVVLASSAQRLDREARYVDLFEEQRVRGLILAPIAGISQRVMDLRDRGTPVVILGAGRQPGHVCSVSLDSEFGGFLAVDHLIRQRRTRIAVVGGPHAQISERVAGARRAAAEHAVQLSFMETSDLTVPEGYAAGERIGRMPPRARPDGVFAANDLVAIGLLQALVRAEHLRVPRDVAVIGHDDIDFAAAAAVPLSTIRQPVAQIARDAVELVIREADEGVDHVHQRRLLSPELVVRESTSI